MLRRDIELKVGRSLRVIFDDNLKYILGFKSSSFISGSYESDQMPATLQDREQLLFIETNIIESVPFGIKKLPVLREFIHDVHSETKIIEKRFNPLSFIPISKQYIPSITIAIVDQRGKPIFIEDVKTVLILLFRRMN